VLLQDFYLEESPDSVVAKHRVIPDRGNFRESATENNRFLIEID